METNLSPLTRWVRRYFFGWNLFSPLFVGVFLTIITLIWGNPIQAIFCIPYAFAIWIAVDLIVWLLGHPLMWLANRFGHRVRNGGEKWKVTPYLQSIHA